MKRIDLISPYEVNVKIKNEEDRTVKVCFLFEASTFGDAETKAVREFEEDMDGTEGVLSIRKSSLVAIYEADGMSDFDTEESPKFFAATCKMKFTNAKGKIKVRTVRVLVHANETRAVSELLTQNKLDLMGPEDFEFSIPCITLTNISGYRTK